MVSCIKKNKKRKDNKRIAAVEVIFENGLDEKISKPGSASPFFDIFNERGLRKKADLINGYVTADQKLPNPLRKVRHVFRQRFRASMTVEAAMVTPLFVFALTVLISIIMVTGVQMRVRKAVYESVRSASSAPYSLGLPAGARGRAFTKTAALGAVKGFFLREMGGHTTASGLIDGGAGGVKLTTDMFNSEAAAIHVTASYNAKLPLAFFSGGSISVTQELKSYAWLGDEFMDGHNTEKIVYITPHGSVYHEDINCTYLKPAVYGESMANVSSARNAGGEKYRECEACTKKSVITPAVVYITKYGNRYHTNPNCVKIRHEVISVPLSKVSDRHLCMKEQGMRHAP